MEKEETDKVTTSSSNAAVNDPFAQYNDMYTTSWTNASKGTKEKEVADDDTSANEQVILGHGDDPNSADDDFPFQDLKDELVISKEDEQKQPALVLGNDEPEGMTEDTVAQEALPSILDVGPDMPKLVKIPGESSSHESNDTQTKKNRKSRRQIPVYESPIAIAQTSDFKDLYSLSPSKPTKYHKPPKATGRAGLNAPDIPHGANANAGDNAPASMRGLVKGLLRMLGGSNENLKYYKEKYSSTLQSPDARLISEATKKADRRAGRTHDLVDDENRTNWHMQCKMRASERDTEYVRDMKVVFKSKATDNFNDPIVVFIGAHYSKRMIPREDMLLHSVKLLNPLVNNPYTIVYFHSNVNLPKKPAVGFFKSLNVALGDKHAESIKAIYVVHATPLLRTWILSFQLRVNVQLFKKVVFLKSISELRAHISSPALYSELPNHVWDAEGNRPIL